MSKHKISRRKFLGQASCAGVGYATLFSSLLSLKSMNALAIGNSSISGGEDYKALVCLALTGGNDSFNMLVPIDPESYAEYAETRSNLALAKETLLPLNATGTQGKEFGLHPSMSEMQQLFNDGKLTFINNIGTLIRPTTKVEFENETGVLPLGLFSHADQIQQWQTGMPHKRSAIGWGGKIADLIHSMNTNNKISMNISLSGSNVFESGNNTLEYVIDSEGGAGIMGYNGMYDFNTIQTKAIDNLMDKTYVDVFKKAYAGTIKNSIEATNQFKAAIEQVPTQVTTFTDNYLSNSFKMVAKTIAARKTLGFKRQIFFIEYSGWDHHDEVLNAQLAMLKEVSAAIGEFYQVLEEMGLTENVTTFSTSDFGRTLTSNGNGTDHAWGGNVFVMGGAVNGKKMYGQYPSLALGNPLDIQAGSLIPTTSTDEYFAELAIWFGVPKSELKTLFPNIGTFYATGSNDAPMGFIL